MLVLADLHHFELYQSLQLLFEKRLGWQLYRPIGMEWWKEGFWNVFPHEDTARQYLGYNCEIKEFKDVHGNPLPESAILNLNYKEEDGIYTLLYHCSPFVQRAVHLEKFKNMRFDLIISSIPQHVEPFNELRKKYQPQAKHIFQVGNNWAFKPDVDGVLSSSKRFRPSDAKKFVFYHQEFLLDDSMRVICQNPKSIVNLMHWAGENTKNFMENLEKQLPDWKIRIMGAGNRDGAAPKDDTTSVFKENGFLCHLRKDEGFGYNIHRAIALGRPVITHIQSLQNMTAGLILEENQTAFDADDPRLISKLKQAAEDHETFRQNCMRQFDKTVRWDEEFEEIKKFLGKIFS